MKMKRLITALHGLVFGFLGTWWAIIGIVFITHPDSSPGTKDWEEDRYFIPFGFIMELIWLAVLAFTVFKISKSKTDTVLFAATALIGFASLMIFTHFR